MGGRRDWKLPMNNTRGRWQLTTTVILTAVHGPGCDLISRGGLTGTRREEVVTWPCQYQVAVPPSLPPSLPLVWITSFFTFRYKWSAGWLGDWWSVRLSPQLLLLITHHFAPATVKLELISRYMQSRRGRYFLLGSDSYSCYEYISLPSDLISGW